jgi:hypothetical protein
MNVDKFIQRASSLGGEVDWVTLKDGINTVRVVAKKGDEQPWRECYRHFLHRHIQEEGYLNKAPICLGDISVCPACQFVESLRKRGHDKEADMARAQRRFIFTVISRDSPLNNAGELCIKLMECPPTVFQGLGRVVADWEGMDFTDLNEGYDVEILRNTQANITKYEVRPKTELRGGSKNIIKTPLTELEKQLIEESFPDFELLMSPPDPADLARVLSLSIEVGEPPVMGSLADRQSPRTGASEASSQTTGISDPVNQCPLYGEGWEDDDACRECSFAEECKRLTEAKRRRPVRK